MGDAAEFCGAETEVQPFSRRTGALARLGDFAGEPAVTRFRIARGDLRRAKFNAT